MGGDSKRVKVEEGEDAVDTSATYAWVQCAPKPADERVIVKEHAVERAIHHVGEICELLRKYSKDEESPGAQPLQEWIDLVGE